MKTYSVSLDENGKLQVTTIGPGGLGVHIEHGFPTEATAHAYAENRRIIEESEAALRTSGHRPVDGNQAHPPPPIRSHWPSLSDDTGTGQVADAAEDGKDAAAARKGKEDDAARARTVSSRGDQELHQWLPQPVGRKTRGRGEGAGELKCV